MRNGRALLLVLLLTSIRALGDPGAAGFAVTTAVQVTEGSGFSAEIQRSSGDGPAAIQVNLGGDAAFGTDYEAYAVTPARNPSIGSEQFGWRLAAWGTNLFAASSEAYGYGGAVVLWDGQGRPLGIITNPAPDVAGGFTISEDFGSAIAFVASNVVAVGAEGDDSMAQDAGGVYLFSWNGTGATFMASFTDPFPDDSDRFGAAIERLNTNVFIVGAFDSDPVVADTGAAYIYRWNGSTVSRLASVNNPRPDSGDVFGRSIAALSTNRFVVGNEYDDWGTNLNAGTAFLFEWNGASSVSLKTTITNPAPGTTDQFGHAVVALSSNQFLVSADGFDPYPAATNAGQVFAYAWDGTNAVLLGAITNPAAAPNSQFGYALSVLASNRFVVGAWGDDTGATNAGIAYLYDWNGGSATLLATLTNPTPQVDDYFGNAVLGLASNCFLVAAYKDNARTTDDGSIYFYAWDGVNAGVVTQIVHEAPANFDSFGAFVDGMASNRFVIGAPSDHGGGVLAGAAYLYEWTGLFVDLLAVVTNPSQAQNSQFGSAVAGLDDRAFVVGAWLDGSEASGAGRAYLFEWDGTNAGLRAAITNPTAAADDNFGSSLAAMGGGRFVVGAKRDGAGAAATGVAYLYSWNGASVSLLATVTNPTPAAEESFGSSVAGLGAFRFVVGADYAFQGTAEAGQAYLYEWNGSTVSLLATVSNPAPQAGDAFGAAVAGLGSSRFLVGAPDDLVGGISAGRAFLYEWDGSDAVPLAVITNPTPASADKFGASLAGLSSNRFAVGADQDFPSGIAYLYEWTGQSAVRLTTITNPSPVAGSFESFGTALAAVDNLGLLAGDPGDSEIGPGAGGAWLYRTARPGGFLRVDFESGRTSAAVHVFTRDDSLLEYPEQVSLSLGAGLGVVASGTTSVVFVIEDNDPWARATTRPFLVAPTLGAIVWTDTVAGTSYELQVTSNLLDAAWATSAVFTATGSSQIVVFPYDAGATAQVYRLVW